MFHVLLFSRCQRLRTATKEWHCFKERRSRPTQTWELEKGELRRVKPYTQSLITFFLMVEFSYKWHGSSRPYILAWMLSSHGGTLGYWIKHLYDCGAGSLRDVRALLWFVFMVHTTQPSSKSAFVDVRSALILVDWRSETLRSVLWHSSAYTFELKTKYKLNAVWLAGQMTNLWTE